MSWAGSMAARSPPTLGPVLLREVEQRTRIRGWLSKCFTHHRDPDPIEDSVEALIKQWVLGLCLGYEDLNDRDELYRARLLALLSDRNDLTGEFRRLGSDRGKPLGGKSMLNRGRRPAGHAFRGRVTRVSPPRPVSTSRYVDAPHCHPKWHTSAASWSFCSDR